MNRRSLHSAILLTAISAAVMLVSCDISSNRSSERSIVPDAESEQVTRMPAPSSGPRRAAVIPSKPDPAPDRAPAAAAVHSKRIPDLAVPAEYLYFPASRFPDAVAVVSLPADYFTEPQKRYPLVIAFGGAGECAREPEEGALAWAGYYDADEAAVALGQETLTEEHFRGLVTVPQLAAFNQRLLMNPYSGIILACPYSPPLSTTAKDFEQPGYERFIMDELIPELKKRYRTIPGAVGVDGVSMGGARSFYYGFSYPQEFLSIGAVQGAFGPHMATYARLVKENGNSLKSRAIQIVTSDDDVLAPSSVHMHELLLSNDIDHIYSVLTGPHDYIFNQGPGSIALLMFHNEALRSGKGAEEPSSIGRK